MTIGKNNRGGMPPAGFERAAVFGSGPDAASWVALFLANGLWVRMVGVDPDVEHRVRAIVGGALPELEQLGLRSKGAEARLSFAAEPAWALAAAHVVLDAGDAALGSTQARWAEIERLARGDALLVSTNPAIPATMQAARLADPGRVLIGHGPAPPHLLAAVEVIAARAADASLVDRTAAFYRVLGKSPVVKYETLASR